jgi:hypothetical protein
VYYGAAIAYYGAAIAYYGAAIVYYGAGKLNIAMLNFNVKL